LYITNKDSFNGLDSLTKGAVACLFLLGAFIQIGVAVRNKRENYQWFNYWDQYLETKQPEKRMQPKTPARSSIEGDLLYDWISVGLFFLGTCWLGTALFSRT
jgi:hypothetical protein